jgi:hypothetical protein
MLIKDLLEMKRVSDEQFEKDAKKFADALVDLVRDEDDEPLSDAELKAEVTRVAKKHGLSPNATKRLRLAAEGPIGY